MTKKFVIASIAVFVVWSIMDYVMHRMLLAHEYEVTAALWRPMEEMCMGMIYGITLISAFLFAAVYTFLINPKNTKNAAIFGLLWGLSIGIGAAYGSYTVMPLTLTMAHVWFVGTVLEGLAGGYVLSLIVKAE